MSIDDSTTPARRVQSGIYQIKCLANGKVYIGSAVNIRSRWASHRHDLAKGKHHSRHLQRAWDKYGPEQFVFKTLQHVADPADLVRIEQEYIDRIRPFERAVGFNISPTAGNCLGVKHPPEACAKNSERLKGRTFSDAHRARLSEAGKRRAPSAEAAARTASKWKCPEYREKVVSGLRRYKRTPEHQAKISAAQKGRKNSPEHARKLAEGRRRWLDDPANRAFLSALSKGRKISDQERRRRSEAMKGKKLTLGRRHSPESIAKMAEAAREMWRRRRGPATHQKTFAFLDGD